MITLVVFVAILAIWLIATKFYRYGKYEEEVRIDLFITGCLLTPIASAVIGGLTTELCFLKLNPEPTDRFIIGLFPGSLIWFIALIYHISGIDLTKPIREFFNDCQNTAVGHIGD